MTTIVSELKVTGLIIPEKATVGLTDQKVLFVAQKTAVGTAVSGALRSNVLNDNAWNAETGENSMMSGMIRGYRSINTVTQLDYIALDDNGTTKATGLITFVGTATEAGTLIADISSEKNHRYLIPVVVGSTETTLAAALVALITADAQVPVTAGNAAGVLTATAVNAGLEGNFITLKVSGTVAGITFTVGAMTGGATNPVLTGLFDVVEGIRYQTVVIPQSYGLSVLTDFLDPRFNVTNDVLDGIGVVSITDTFSNLIATAGAENSQSLGIHANKLVDDAAYKGSSLLELDTVIAAKVAAVRSLRLTEGADVSAISIAASRGFRDAFGGIHMSSLPYHNTPVDGLPISDPQHGFEPVEIQQLNDAGAFVIGANRSKTDTILGTVVTTYKTDAAANEDDSFKTFNQVDQLSAIREFAFVNQKKEYAQSRVTGGDLQPNYSNANPTSIRAFNVGLYKALADVVVVRSGADAIKKFKETHVVEITNEAKGEVFQEWVVEPVSQLRNIRFTIQPSFRD